MSGKIAFQGERGANSEIACLQAYPHLEALPCRTFEDVFAAVENEVADLAMIPVENTIAGRVADIHHLIPASKLHMIAEHFLPIRFQLMALPGTELSEVRRAKSHIMGLGQCRNFLREHNIEAVTAADTAGAARQVAEAGDKHTAAIAPALAAEVYGLEILAENIEDEDHNTTRFVIMSREPNDLTDVTGPCKTALMFTVRNVPAALYKGLGGFATNGVNVTKLESYLTGGSFTAAQFYAEFEGHPEERSVQLALEELGFFSTQVRVFGVYPQGERQMDILPE
ncbi:prephenate dehydratase [Ponticaulis sp.]|uniref:prephenate dehydratase n=1 Tax=Ponticaulis sp. TaxID=2020902 RepID=UPI000B6474DF|nr:prephenate dehydratase [Ponticaulis sp.]MAI90298.1 prephenate dehydratase [Ponticaulis sp.]OUX99939.1 MAG: prephenate dehydratase [Hyphomonadaceae bacterium TMED5]|tara:strand:- start:277198 stop:278046 length:849 start_codon:yes stop_codon:yes gene_type:complete